MVGEMEVYRIIATSILKNKRFVIRKDNSLIYPTSNLSKNEIILTEQAIPLKASEKVKIVLMEGNLIHECGHLIKSKVMNNIRRILLNKYTNMSEKIIQIATNILEDKRVNYYLKSLFRFDFGRRIELSEKIYGEILKQDLLNAIENKNKEKDFNEDFYLIFLIINSILLYGNFNYKLPEKIKKELTFENLEDIEKAKEILEKAKYCNLERVLQKYVEDLLQIFLKYIQKDGNVDMGREAMFVFSTPNIFGGKKDLSFTKENLKKVEKLIEESNIRTEEFKEKDTGSFLGTGYGDGLLIDAPKSNINEYNRIVEKNRSIITRLLNYLKKIEEINTYVEKWCRSGRLMYNVVGKAYVNSLRNIVNNIHLNYELGKNKKKYAICLLIDVSGSVNLELVKDVLTIIGEAFSRWRTDDELAILVFGSNYQKIKVFLEKYNNIKGRIGGINCLGGTVMSNVLYEIRNLFKSVGKREKILIIVSDFGIYDAEETKKMLNKLRKDGVKLIGIDLFGEKNEFMNDNERMFLEGLESLPEEFFKIIKSLNNNNNKSLNIKDNK